MQKRDLIEADVAKQIQLVGNRPGRIFLIDVVKD
jgi:hypothetical protein